jgi:hypothetical protein
MTFAWTPKQWHTVEAFATYVSTLSKPAWVEGVTLHHTLVPVPTQWRGLASMESLGTYYRVTKGWGAGPHLFLCIGAPNPFDDGIFLGTPLATPGVHAGACNSSRWGIEVVGNFDRLGWSPRLKDLVYRVVLELADLGGFEPGDTNGHRECLANKSCPGAAINMATVRRELHEMSSVKGRYLAVTEPRGANVRQGPGVSFPVAAKLPDGYVFFSDKTIEGEVVQGSNQWAHFYGPDRATPNELGFVWSGIVKEVAG